MNVYLIDPRVEKRRKRYYMNVYLTDPALKNDEKGTHFSSEIDARDPWPCVTHLTSRE